MSDKILPSRGDVVHGPLECWDPRDRGLTYIVDDIQSLPTKGILLILKLHDPGEYGSEAQYVVSSHALSYNGEFWECDTEPQLRHSDIDEERGIAMNSIDEMNRDLEVLKSARDMILPIVTKYEFNASAIPDYWIQEVEQRIRDFDPFKDIVEFINKLEYVDTTTTHGYIAELVGSPLQIMLYVQNHHLKEIHKYVKFLQEKIHEDNKPIAAAKLGPLEPRDSASEYVQLTDKSYMMECASSAAFLYNLYIKTNMTSDLTEPINPKDSTIKMALEFLNAFEHFFTTLATYVPEDFRSFILHVRRWQEIREKKWEGE